MMNRLRLRVANLLGVVMTVAAPAAADPVADFYRGQTISLLVGANTGGGYDAYARPVSRHLGRFIPGEPNIVVRYMGSAGGLPAANALYTTGTKDGLTLGALQRIRRLRCCVATGTSPTIRSSSSGSRASIRR